MVFYCPKEAQMDEIARNTSILRQLMAGRSRFKPAQVKTPVIDVITGVSS